MKTRAVLLDALGTLVALEPPAPRLRSALAEQAGIDVGAHAARRGFEAEIAYYREHHMEGGDALGLERLRDDCGRVMHEALDVPGLEQAAVRRAMIDALEFTPFPDAEPALRALRRRGLRLVVVSNWDCSLGHWLEVAGLRRLLDAAVSSAEVGEPKPSAAAFRAGLVAAGVEAHEALHAGDSLANDVQGARAAGIRAVLVDRRGAAPAGVQSVASLEGLASLL